MMPRLPKLRLRERTILGLVVVLALLLTAWDAFLNPVRRWKRTIHDDNGGSRRWEAASLGVRGRADGIGREAAIRELILALADPSFRVRETAAVALGQAGPPAEAAIPDLIAALGDGHPWVRKAAADSLGTLLQWDGSRAGPAIPALIRALKDRGPDVRLKSACSLAMIGEGEAAIPTLITFLRSVNQSDRMFAIWALGRSGPGAKAALPDLIALTGDPASLSADHLMRHRRIEAAELLFRLGETTSAGQILMRACEDADPSVRQAALRSVNVLKIVEAPHSVGPP